MGFLDKAKEQLEASNAKRKAVAETRGKLIATMMTDYTGGYKTYRKATGAVAFYENKTIFSVAFRPIFEIDNNTVQKIAIEGQSQVSRRITATRLIALGVFALAFQKKTVDKEAFIALELTTGEEVIFFFKNSSPTDLKRKYGANLNRVQKAVITTHVSQSGSIAEEIGKLSILKDKGILTEEEFAEQKKKLLS